MSYDSYGYQDVFTQIRYKAYDPLVANTLLYNQSEHLCDKNEKYIRNYYRIKTILEEDITDRVGLYRKKKDSCIIYYYYVGSYYKDFNSVESANEYIGKNYIGLCCYTDAQLRNHVRINIPCSKDLIIYRDVGVIRFVTP